jgi:hypothetical protein
LKKNGAGGIRTPGAFRHNGFQDRCTENTSLDKTKTCESIKEQLTPQLTPKSQKQPKNTTTETQQLPADLAEIFRLWPELPEHIKAAIKALVQTHKTEKK